MAFTHFQIPTYGTRSRSYIGEGISNAASSISNAIIQRSQIIQAKRDKYKQAISRDLEGLEVEDLELEQHKQYAGDQVKNLEENTIPQWMLYDDDGNKKKPRDRGTLTFRQQAKLATEIKKIQSDIETRKGWQDSYLKAKGSLLNDKEGYYDEAEFKLAEQHFLETGEMPEGGFLSEAPINLYEDVNSFNNNLAPTDVETVKGNIEKKERSFNINDLDRTMYFNDKYSGSEGYRKTIRNYYENSVTPQKDVEYHQLAYFNLEESGKPVNSNTLEKEAIRIFGEMEVAPLYGKSYILDEKELSSREMELRRPKENEKLTYDTIPLKPKEINGVQFNSFKDLTNMKYVTKTSILVDAIELTKDGAKKISGKDEYTFDVLGVDHQRNLIILRTRPQLRKDEDVSLMKSKKTNEDNSQVERSKIIAVPLDENMYLLNEFMTTNKVPEEETFILDNLGI